MIERMRELRLSTIGGVAAVLAVAGFAAGIAMMATNGVQVLIPETGKEGAEWAADVQDAGNWFVVGAAIVGLAGFAGIIALIGFYDVLKGAGPAMILAPILGAVGLTLVTVSHVVPIAIAQELAPSYSPLRADTFDTFAAVFAGWLGLLAPASSLIEGLTTIGFFAFFVFLAATGVAILRRREPSPEAATAPVV
jgi:hypothetical protein